MPKKVTISSRSYNDGWWTLDAKVELDGATRVGPHSVQLPEDATEDQLAQAVLDLYATPPAE